MKIKKAIVQGMWCNYFFFMLWVSLNEKSTLDSKLIIWILNILQWKCPVGIFKGGRIMGHTNNWTVITKQPHKSFLFYFEVINNNFLPLPLTHIVCHSLKFCLCTKPSNYVLLLACSSMLLVSSQKHAISRGGPFIYN